MTAAMQSEPATTIARLLEAIRRVELNTVRVFCHPDDHERAAAACELLPLVVVTPHELVPAGQLYIYNPEGRTQP